MKKLMKFLDTLSRDEMRSVVGGYDGGGNCYNCCESAEQACIISCGGGGCNVYDCIVSQWGECQRVLGCSCP